MRPCDSFTLSISLTWLSSFHIFCSNSSDLHFSCASTQIENSLPIDPVCRFRTALHHLNSSLSLLPLCPSIPDTELWFFPLLITKYPTFPSVYCSQCTMINTQICIPHLHSPHTSSTTHYTLYTCLHTLHITQNVLCFIFWYWCLTPSINLPWVRLTSMYLSSSNCASTYLCILFKCLESCVLFTFYSISSSFSLLTFSFKRMFCSLSSSGIIMLDSLIFMVGGCLCSLWDSRRVVVANLLAGV